jgi:hypothetical protein
MNYFTCSQEPRGYYLHVQPYEIEDYGTYKMRSIIAFSGYKTLLLEVGRKSAKQFKNAVDMVNDDLINSLLVKCKFD